MVQQVNFNDPFNTVENVQNQAQLQIMQQQASRAAEAVQPFDSLLQSTVDRGQGLKFSAHAKERLGLRNITLSAADLNRMNEAVNKAAAKGARQSLLVMENQAFIVSVPNRTVITALDSNSMKENVFTNIDSAVIV
ncbi:MAG TPA: TIGR02530 family flagellar biosynthesis protein [bacterium]|nr:TIGR02530 family flagellar biosynthesis protein [bacterium]